MSFDDFIDSAHRTLWQITHCGFSLPSRPVNVVNPKPRYAYFVSAFTSEDRSYIPALPQINNHREIFIGKKRFKEILRGLKQEKSQGPDGIHPAILKLLSRSIAKPVTIIFRRSL